MLSEKEMNIISETISSSEHDYFVWSSLVGEPFLIDGFICYFDGVTAAISGVPLADGKPANRIKKRISKLIYDWMQKPEVTFINYFGPEREEVLIDPKFSLIYEENPIDYNLDLFVALDSDLSNKNLRKLRQDINRATRNEIRIEARKLEFFTAEQLRLFSQLSTRTDLEISDVSYLINAAAILHHDSSIAFEAKIKNKVVGIGIAHQYFKGKPFFVSAAFDFKCIGVSDAIYSAVITYFRSLGAKWLGLGYAATEGQYRYKKKWGGRAVTPPCWQMIWRRKDTEMPFRDSLHWPWRLLGDKWCSLNAL